MYALRFHKTHQVDTNNSPMSTRKHTVVPPPQRLHVEPMGKPLKIPNSNSPLLILFAIQRETVKFPQNSLFHLVTQFPVYLRVLPFSDFPPKAQFFQNLFNPLNWPSFWPILVVPLLRDGGLSYFICHPFIVTHILIYFFIQYSFSHKFLKPY
jgi:hypothetical protein